MAEQYNEKDESKVSDGTTTAEKILALALTVFLLIGGLWAAENITQFFPPPDWAAIRAEHIPASVEAEFNLLAQEQNELAMTVQRHTEAVAAAQSAYEKAREEYRTLLDRGIDDRDKRLRWEETRLQLETLQKEIAVARAALDTFTTDVFAPQKTVFLAAQQRYHDELGRQNRARNLVVGVALLTYALAVFALTFLVFNLFRTRRSLSRYVVVGNSVLGFGALQALILFYRVVYPALRGLLPVELIISVGGAAISIAGIVFLKNRFFSNEAIRNRRLWRKSCPNCGFPHPSLHCAWCGAGQVAPCPQCHARTNNHLPYCGECGAKR
ncbi:MAG: hypothetical protein KGZ50_10350 [Peptococcaceae bacterium]|nr:hypothetical protein [Peptococcaceae bacterium]